MTKEELTRIYELALEGKTNREIGEKLYYDEALISSHIRKLKDNESKFYNLEL